MRTALRNLALAAAAFAVGAGGTAIGAGHLLAGSKIRKNSIPQSKLSKGALARLRGAAGPAGPPGPIGPAGPRGVVGPGAVPGLDGAPGKPGGMLVGGTFTPSAPSYFAALYSPHLNQGATEASVAFPAPSGSTAIGPLTVHLAAAATSTLVFTLRDNFATTLLTCTIPAGSLACAPTNGVPVTLGDQLDLGVTGGYVGAPTVSFSARLRTAS